jgi:hypothetical protein
MNTSYRLASPDLLVPASPQPLASRGVVGSPQATGPSGTTSRLDPSRWKRRPRLCGAGPKRLCAVSFWRELRRRGCIGTQSSEQALTTTTLTMVMGAWLVIVFGLLGFPLTAFSKPLMQLKKETLSATSAQATQFHRATERKILGRNISAPLRFRCRQGPVGVTICRSCAPNEGQRRVESAHRSANCKLPLLAQPCRSGDR